MRIACRYDQTTIADGASIACNGVCLTVVASGVEAARPGSTSMPPPRRFV
jgi:riboflavin synthase